MVGNPCAGDLVAEFFNFCLNFFKLNSDVTYTKDYDISIKVWITAEQIEGIYDS